MLLFMSPRDCEAQAYSSATIVTLGDFVAAAANTSITTFLLKADIALNSTELKVFRPGQSVSIIGDCSGGRCPILDGLSKTRILNVQATALLLRGVSFINGRSIGTTSGLTASGGGCLQATVNASAVLDGTSFSGCATNGPGGCALVVSLQGALTVTNATGSAFTGCSSNTNLARSCNAQEMILKSEGQHK